MFLFINAKFVVFPKCRGGAIRAVGVMKVSSPKRTLSYKAVPWRVTVKQTVTLTKKSFCLNDYSKLRSNV